jgi:deoxyribose-phosphate aldolase
VIRGQGDAATQHRDREHPDGDAGEETSAKTRLDHGKPSLLPPFVLVRRPREDRFSRWIVGPTEYSHRPMATTHRPDTLARERAHELVRSWDGRPGALGPLLGRVSSVDQVGVEERVDSLKKRSIKKASKLWALDLAIRMIDLTTLEGKDTPGKIRALAAKAIHPQPGDPGIPSVAALCVYPALVEEAKDALKGSTVKVASVATGFPSGQTFRDIKIAETRAAAEAGADEIDMVIDRGAFLRGDYLTVFEEIVDVKEACGDAHLKVILETGELETYDNVRRASVLAMAAGADFIKTSTGKVQPAATLPVTLVMFEAARDFERQTGRQVGIKPAGGIRTAKESIQYLVVLYETLGPRWMTPDYFRFGASSLLNDVLMQIEKERTGRYQGPDHFTLD